MQTGATKQIFILMTVAYIFSIAVRMIWVYQFNGYDSFLWNGQLMINTNDGYYFAEKARDILNGTLNYIDGVDSNGAVALVTVLLVKILPFSFETIILYMPAFLGSLLVVPLVLIGYTLKRPYIGFVAGLFASIVWSYYNRTMTGYYDSDMMNIVWPMFVFWSIVHSLITQKNRYLVLMILFMVLSQWWYPKNIALNTAMVFMGALYVVLKDRHNLFNLKFIAFALIGLAFLPFYSKVALALVLFGLFHYKDELTHKYIYPILGVLLVSYVYSGALNGILSSLNLYLIQRFFPAETLEEVAQLHFYGVIGTVREAGAIPFETFANRISGHTITFFVATLGVVMMMVRYPILIISLPLVAMGFMAYKSGLRFTVYAVPIYALGFAYMVLYLVHLSESFMDNKENVHFKKIFLAIVLVCLALYPNIQHIIAYKVPTVLNATEVKDLDKLKKISSSDDYTLSWWDYGYPIRYYTATKTIIDGGKHQNDNFIISKIMQTSSPELAANLSRLAVETYVDSNYSVVANTLFNTKEDPRVFLKALEDPNYALPKKTRDVYLYLPYRMMNIFPTVAVFGNLDLSTGRKERRMVFSPGTPVKAQGDWTLLSSGRAINMKQGIIQEQGHNIPIHTMYITQRTREGYHKNMNKVFHREGKYSVVYMKDYNVMVMMDNETLKSTYVQMFMLEKFDKNLFELVVASPYSKIYRLKK